MVTLARDHLWPKT